MTRKQDVREAGQSFWMARWEEGYRRGYLEGYAAGTQCGRQGLLVDLLERLQVLADDVRLGLRPDLETPLEVVQAVLALVEAVTEKEHA